MKCNKTISRRSLRSLNGVNFLIAGMTGVIPAFLATFLKENNWNYKQIGIVLASGWLGFFLFQIIAGIISNHVKNRRFLLALATLVLGIIFSFLPSIVNNTLLVYFLVFLAGIAGSFFIPLLASLALSLAGQSNFASLIGMNRSWNHLGNIAAALLALLLVKFIGINAIFYFIGVTSILAATSIYTICAEELHAELFQTETHSYSKENFRTLFAQAAVNYQTLILIICVILFHFVNVPLIPTISLYLKHLEGKDEKIAAIILITQITMVPVSLIAAKYSQYKDIKWVLSIAFIILPIRIFLSCLTTYPYFLLAIQVLDGISTGIYGVAICLICKCLTQGNRGFNILLSIMLTASSLGGLMGLFVAGFLLQSLGFLDTFLVLALIAIIGAVLFVRKM